MRHYLDKKNKKDYILSLSFKDSNIKIWDINSLEYIINLTNIYLNGYLFSACMFYDNNQNYIITCNYELDSHNCNPIKIFDFEGNFIKDINNTSENTYFIDVYFDNKESKNYILTGNYGHVKSYDYYNNSLYHIYNDFNELSHNSITINDNNEIIELIESSLDGIRIWDFHSGTLLNKILECDGCLNGIRLWNHNYLFVCCDEGLIKLIDLKKNIIIKSIDNESDELLTVKTINLPNYGECLLSQSSGIEAIKIYGIQ